MVFYSDIRAPAVKISLNGCLVRFILEETFEEEFTEKYIETLTLAIEYRLQAQISSGATIQLHEIISETHSNM
jgi:hypothetical protein